MFLINHCWIALGKLVATYIFATSLFCEPVPSLFRTCPFFRPRQLVPVLKLYFLHSPLCCKDLAWNRPKNKQGLEEQSWQLQRSCEWQGYDGSQGGQNHNCMVSGIELEKYSTGHEMLNQQWESQIFPNTNLKPLEKTSRYIQLGNFTLLHYRISI